MMMLEGEGLCVLDDLSKLCCVLFNQDARDSCHEDENSITLQLEMSGNKGQNKAIFHARSI
jgi:hypothetical protein